MKRTTNLALTIQADRESGFGFGGGYFHINCHPVLISDKIRNCPDGRYEDPINGFARLGGLEITAQGENDQRDRGLYAFQVRYRNVTFVDKYDAEQMAKTLQRIERRMHKLQATRGYAATFSEYVGRVAEVLGATAMLERKEENPNATLYKRENFFPVTVGEGVSYIRSLEARWKEEGKKQEAEVSQ